MLLIIEGNICAGKSSFMNELSGWCIEHHKNVNFISEPHETWSNFKDKDGNNALTAYYNDIASGAVSFQLLTFCARLAMLQKSYQPGIINVIERTPLTTLEIFGEMLVGDGHITRAQQSVFKELGRDLIPQFLYVKKIFIDTPVDICYQRSCVRDGGSINHDYFMRLDRTYRDRFKFCDKTICAGNCDNYHKIDGTTKFFFDNLFN